jgi:GntR family transcriptional regulator
LAFSVDTMPFQATPPRRSSGAPPLYRQVADDLARHLRSGALAPGDRLPAEPILAEAYGINRLTVREAIGGLVRLGLVRRVHGVGSFVADRPARHRVTTLDLDLSDVLRADGVTVRHEVLGIAAEGPTGVPGGAFPAFPGPVARLRIRRWAGETPWSQSLTWLPASLLYPDPRLRPETSVADLLRERHELELAPRGWLLVAEPADEGDAEHLQVVAGAPIVVLGGAEVDGQGRRIAHVVERVRADRIELAITPWRVPP